MRRGMENFVSSLLYAKFHRLEALGEVIAHLRFWWSGWHMFLAHHVCWCVGDDVWELCCHRRSTVLSICVFIAMEAIVGCQQMC